MKRGLALSLLIVSFGLQALAQSKAVPDEKTAARKFVQTFYTWYMKQSPQGTPTMDTAIEKKASLFEPKLLRSLKEDSAAQAKVPDEIVGLDFDPFLNSQDPGINYQAERVIPKGKTFWVEVYSVRNGKKGTTPDVVPEVENSKSGFQFVNFHYGKTEFEENENLVSVLRVLKDSRAKYPVSK